MLRTLAAQQTCSARRAAAHSRGVRWLSAIHYDSTSSDVEALLHETLVCRHDAARPQSDVWLSPVRGGQTAVLSFARQDKRQKRDDSPQTVLTTKGEALSLCAARASSASSHADHDCWVPREQ